MRKKLFGRHGSITIFLCLILSAIIVLESIFISGAYRRKREVILTEAVNHQAEQIMSQFNKDYLDWYGIYALDSIEAGSSVFETMTSGMEETSFQYELTDKLGPEDIRTSIIDFMKLRGIAFEGHGIIERLGASLKDLSRGTYNTDKLSTWLPKFKKYVQNREKYSFFWGIVKKICEATGIEDKVQEFTNFVDQLDDVWRADSSAAFQAGDTSIVLSIYDPTCVSTIAGVFDRYLDWDMPALVDRFLINEYASFSFDSLVKSYEDSDEEEECNILGIPFSDIHGENRLDLEYLLVGNDSDFYKRSASFGFLLGTRLILDLSAFFMDSGKRKLALAIAEVMSILIMVISCFTVIISPRTLQFFVIFAMAYIRAFSDVLKLTSGKTVPLFYNDKVTNKLGKFADTVYRDYYRVFLFLVPEDKLLSRMQYIIEKDCGEDLYTGVRATGTWKDVSYQVERRYSLYETES